MLVADFTFSCAPSAAPWPWPSFEDALDVGFLPCFVGVEGVCGFLPAAGEGAMVLDVRAVRGDGVLDPAVDPL